MNRAELKAKAKEQIKGKIGILFLISLIIGAISGAADTFLSKNKSKSLDATLSKITVVLAVLFIALTLVLNLNVIG